MVIIWWLRSPNVSNSNNVRYVNTDGTLNNNNANNAYGAAPDCVYSQLKVSRRYIYQQPKSVHHMQGTIVLSQYNGQTQNTDAVPVA